MGMRPLSFKNTILLFLMFFCCNSKAIVSLHDHSSLLEIGDQIEILEDPSGTLPFDQVRQSRNFTPSQRSRPSFGFSSSVYWVRFRLANLSSKSDWFLQVRYAPLDYVDFYAPIPGQRGKFTRYQGGDLVPPAPGSRKQTYIQFPLLADSKVHTYYLRIATESSVIIPLRIMTRDKLMATTVAEQYFQGAYFGLMSVMALYNFFVFLVIRDRSYLYYTGFITSTAVFQIALHGYAAVHFWPQSLWWNNISNLFAACLSAGFCGLFARSFIQLRNYNPTLNLILGVISGLCFCIGGLSLVLNYQLIVSLISIASFAVVSTSLVAAAVALRKGSRPAGFYLVAWVILLLFAIIHILMITGILPSAPILENSVQIGGALEAILLSMGLADRINSLQKQALKLSQEANKIKDDFMSTITHELLTPVNGIKLSLDLLKQNLKEPGDRQLLKTADDSSTHLLNLIESMFNFVEIRRGNVRLLQNPADLKWILTSIYDYFESVNDNQSLHIQLEWDPTLPDLIVMDEKKVTSIIVELMKNAFAFTREGHIIIAARRKTKGSQALLEISIQDTGRGISQEKLKRIFEAFDQEDNSYLREHGGLGIGLTMVNDILKLMDSRLEINSQLDKGTTATFKLALQAAQADDIPNSRRTQRNKSPGSQAQNTHTPPSKPENPSKILVVEDNPVNSKLLCKVLQNTGYQTVPASNGQEALDKLDQNSDFKAVLMDCQMPIMDGFQATRIIRRHHIYSNIPIIAITANISVEDYDRCMESGMNDVLTKPVRRSQVEDILDKWIN